MANLDEVNHLSIVSSNKQKEIEKEDVKISAHYVSSNSGFTFKSSTSKNHSPTKQKQH